jgi:Protein of unknown function (DUF3433)
VTEWWRPLPIRKSLITVTVLSPLAVVAVLEILQRRSNSHSGICSVVAYGNITNGLIHFIPAFVLILIAALYDSLSFTACILAPFSALRTRSGASFRHIFNNPVGTLGLITLPLSIRSRYWSISFTVFASMIGSTLTITVSGLYSVKSVEHSTSTTLLQTEVFDLKWSNSGAGDQGAAIITSLIQNLNVSYPFYTFDEIVTPTLKFDSTTSDGQSQEDLESVSSRLSVLRANLDCDFIPSTHFRLTSQPGYYDVNLNNYSDTIVSVSTTISLAPECRLSAQDANLSDIQIGLGYFAPPGNAGMYVASIEDLTSIVTIDSDLSLVADQDLGVYIPSGCPSLIFNVWILRG